MNREQLTSNTDPSGPEISLGGGGQALPYPALALDPQGQGFWGRLDRVVERSTRLLNPILVKEARQSLKSKQFLITFFCLLAASCAWTIMGIVFNAPDVYYVPSGDAMLGGYFVILSVSMFAFIPLVAFRSLAAELDEGTYEMLAITRLSAWRIVSGKMNSAILQMVIYFSAIVPCLAFSYLLRGIGLMTIVFVIGIVFAVAMVLTAFALALSTIATGRTLQTFLLVAMVGLIVIVEFACCGAVFSAVLSEEWGGPFWAYLSWFSLGGCFVIVFMAAAAARIAPVTENRSTRLRGILLVTQTIWIITITYTAWVSEDAEWFNLGLWYLGLYWLAIGVLACGESPVLSPRVRRGLPSTLATRALFTWWIPGPGTGFMFAISTGAAGLYVLAFAGSYSQMINLIPNFGGRGTSVVHFALLMSGYLFGYLGITRLFSMPLFRRFGPSFAIPLAVFTLVSFLGVISPAIFDVATTGEVSNDYTAVHVTNWAWTWTEAFSYRGISSSAVWIIFLLGCLILVVNLFLLFRELRVPKVLIPERVRQDRAAEIQEAENT